MGTAGLEAPTENVRSMACESRVHRDEFLISPPASQATLRPSWIGPKPALRALNELFGIFNVQFSRGDVRHLMLLVH